MKTTTRRRGLLAAVVACVVALTGCKVDTTVSVRSDGDGRGKVSVRVDLDAEAVFALQVGGGTLEDKVATVDLADAGWKVSEWQRQEGGAASMSLSKEFVGEDQLAGILDEIAGTDGLLREPRIDRSRGLTRSSDTVRLTADLTGLGSGLAGDVEVARRLEAAGVDVAALDSSLNDRLESAFGMTVTLAMGGEKRAWKLKPGDERSLVVSQSRIEWDRITTLGISVLLSALAVLLFLSAWLSSRRRRRSRRREPRSLPTW